MDINQYRVVKDHDLDSYIIVATNKIEEDYLVSDTYDCYGQQDDNNYEPGNEDFDNEMFSDLQAKYASKYPDLTDWDNSPYEYLPERGIDFRQDRKNSSIPYSFSTPDGDLLDADDLPLEMQNFIRKYCQEHSNYPTCTCINFWNGSNHESIIFDSSTGFQNERYELLDEDDDEAQDLLKELQEALDNVVKEGTYGEFGVSSKFSFYQSRFEKDSWKFWEATKKAD